LPDDQIQQLWLYVGLLAKWNNKINLTSLELNPPSEEAIDRLLVEPAAVSKRVLPGERFCVDIGSGGGSPAIPLKIAAPWLRMVLVEVKARKCAFLREAARQIPLSDVEVANSKFEELLVRPDLHEAADIVTVRAVRADQKLWASIQAFLKPGGRVFWFTSTNPSIPEVLPPLVLESADPIFPADGSHLVILRKQL
jgi:16S rRNA (guanine527-N7)-methyltransferase